MIDLALQVLRDAISRSAQSPVDTPDVRLALRCLLPHCRDTSSLKGYWQSAGLDSGLRRPDRLTAGLGCIARELRRVGRHPETDPAKVGYVPAGIDPGQWARADERGRKLLVRQARG